MDKPYSKLPRNKTLRVFLNSAILLLALFLALELSLSLIVNLQLNKAKKSFKSDAGLDLQYTIAFFDIFYGASIKNLSIKQDKTTFFDIGSIRLKLDFLETILKRKISCKEVYISRPHIYKVENLDKKYLSYLLATAKNSGNFIKSTLVKTYNLNFMDYTEMDIGGYVALAQNKVFLSRGKIRILGATFLGKTEIDQSNNLLDVPLDYALDATYTNGDFIINKLELISFSARLALSGRINDYENAFDLDIKGELKDFMLEDVKQLNNEYVYARGILASRFSLKGPLDVANFRTDINISNANFKISDFLKLNKVNFDLVWDNNGVHSEKVSLLIDTYPANLSFKTVKQDGKDMINLEFLSPNLDLINDLKLKFQGSFQNNVMGGDIEFGFSRTLNNKIFSKSYDLKGASFNLKDFNFNCKSAQIQLGEKSQAGETRLRKLNAQEISGDISMLVDSLQVNDLEASVYGGIISGDLAFKSSDNALNYNSKILLNNVNSASLADDFLSGEYKLSGQLSGSVILNSKLRENITSDIQIVDGELKDNAVLIAIADFFAMPSLKSVAFSNLKIILYKIWNQYDAKVSLFSPDVSIYLDNKSNAGESLDGYLLVKISTALMDESPRFRQLFKYIGYKEPTVYFPFQLKGYLDKPRIEWLENEFKEKIQDFLPESNKKLLQEALNNLVKDISQ